MPATHDPHVFHTSLEWAGEKKGIIRSPDNPDVAVAAPPEFDGHIGLWSPEELLLSSVETCTLLTFLWFVNKQRLTLISYHSKTTGTITSVDHAFQFTDITVNITIEVRSDHDKTMLEKNIPRIERACLVSNTLKPVVHLIVDIKVSK